MATLEAAPCTDDAIIVALYPDVCRRGKRTVMYDIIALESDDEKHSDDVRITGCWASHEGARLKTVYQDAPGERGVKSGCVEGYARPVAGTASKVLVNGQACVRHDTEFEMNCKGPDGPHNTKGKMAYERGGPSNVVAADGAPAADANPPVELTAGEQAIGVAVGAGDALADEGLGIVQGAADIAQYVTDSIFGGMFDLFMTEEVSWIPSWQRGNRTGVAMMENAAYAVQNPGAVLDALTRDVRALWAQGKYGEAIGRGGVEVLAMVFGPKVDKLRVLKGLPDEALDALVESKQITAAEAAAARAGRGDDGVLVHPKKKSIAEVRAELEAQGFEKVDVDSKDYEVWMSDDQVVKLPRRGEGGAEFAKKYADTLDRLKADPELGDLIPETQYVEDGYIIQERVQGTEFLDLPDPIDDIAMDNADRIVHGAKERFPDLAAQIDENYSNFLYTEGGEVTGWYDPWTDKPMP